MNALSGIQVSSRALTLLKSSAFCQGARIIFFIVIGLIFTVAVANAASNSDSLSRGFRAYDAKNYELSLQHFQEAAQKGNPEAMYMIGTQHENGRGTEENSALAKRWYIEAAQRGQVNAMAQLGYLFSTGADANGQLALKWMGEAAKRGSTWAMFAIAYMYDQGRGVETNYQIAMRWYEQAAARGDSGASNNIGALFAHGQGVKQDNCVANSWYLKALAADAKNEHSLVNLGDSSRYGLCGSADKEKALRYYQTAADLGNARAKQAIADMNRPPARYVSSGGSTSRPDNGSDFLLWQQNQRDERRMEMARELPPPPPFTRNSLGW